MPTSSAPTRPLAAAWWQALYGPDGFYRAAGGPAAHFATSAQGLPGVDELLAEAVVAIAREHELHRIVEIGCGRGELLNLLAAADPPLELLGVDVVERPATLAASAGWLVSPGGNELPDELDGLRGALVLAHEWLDVVPCEFAVRTATGFRILELGPDDELVPGREPTPEEEAWRAAHWPDGDLVEIGLSRDLAYRRLRARIDEGLLVCVDYGHLTGARPEHGTFVGYRAGTVCEPRFDGSTDLTAHVAMDCLGAGTLLRQHEVADRYLRRPERPEHRLAGTDPMGYLMALRRRGAWSGFTDPAGLGSFFWSLEKVTSSGAARR